MENLIRLLKLASREAFQNLRSSSPHYCTALEHTVIISKMYFNHIAYAKSRHLEDLAKRLGMIPLVQQILLYGLMTNVRENNGKQFFRILYKKNGLRLVVIIVKRENEYTLLSSFLMS